MTQSRRILIVEDEPLIAMMLEDFLDALGHKVVATVDNIPGALARIADAGVNAAILDVNLRDGAQCWPIADALSDAGIPFVLATGGGTSSTVEAHRGRPLLSKPFTMDSVSKVLATI